MMIHFTHSVPLALREFLRSVAQPIGLGAGLAAIVLACNDAFSAEQTDNGLLRMEAGRAFFLDPAYERLCQEKLFVTPAEVARYFFVPAFKDPETAVSVHRSPQLAGSLPGNYWVTVTRPTRRLPDNGPSDAKAIKVERRDAPIPESTAQAIHRVWLAMLQKARPRTRLDGQLDSDAMFFSATDGGGKTLRAQYYGPGDDAFELGQIGQFLIGYGYVSGRERTALAREIEAKASALYKRVR